jgi:hypothetical protein
LHGELVMVNLAKPRYAARKPGRAGLGEFLTDSSAVRFADSLKRLAHKQQDQGTLVVRRRFGRALVIQRSLVETGGYAIGSAVDITEQARGPGIAR